MKRLKNRNILCISNPHWEGNYASTIVEVMRVLARDNNMLYVDYANTIKDVVYTILGSGDAPVLRMFGLTPRLRTLHENDQTVHILTPPPIMTINFIPDGVFYRLMLRMNTAWVRFFIKRALKKLGMQEDLAVFNAFNPSMGIYDVDKYKEKSLVYYCYDDIGSAIWAGTHGDTHEREFAPLCDGVIVTSRGLLETKTHLNDNLELVSNGVNFKLFNQGFSTSIPKKVRIGYIGSIDTRLDYSLLDALVLRYPNYEFHFVGRVMHQAGANRLKLHGNVVMHGSMQSDKLPAIMKTFSVGIIPFVKNSFTAGIYPLKINEYLAAGLPVVLTDFGRLEEFNDSTRICSDQMEFLKAVHEEVKNDTSELRRSRAKIAESNSWECRVEIIDKLIDLIEK